MTQTAAFDPKAKAKEQICHQMKELIYQGRNREFLEQKAELALQRLPPAVARDVELLHAALLFDMHRVEEATRILREMILSRPDGWNDHAIMLTVARLSYFEQDYDKAFDLFESVTQHTEVRDMRIKALLGTAAVHFAKGRFYAAAKFIQELETLEPFEHMDQRLGLIYLQGLRATHLDKDPFTAQKMFGMGLKLASERGWNYFILRFLFHSAKIEMQFGKPETLDCYLSLIRDLVSYQQSGYFCYLYNQTFKDHGGLIHSFIEIDAEYRRILLGSKWIDLTDQPEVFNLIRFLRNEDRFVDLKEVVSFLYPDHTYAEQVHFPMVTDLVDQARKRIEAHPQQPKILLGRGNAFRLAAS